MPMIKIENKKIKKTKYIKSPILILQNNNFNLYFNDSNNNNQ